ncbi:hypothetical protein [Microcoleus sp. herbarium5]|uniref:hypothetical protein n=1 Tax=Microcoleus sp. herbarium5 TaxID=3055434 RepID=UPI002FCF4E06
MTTVSPLISNLRFIVGRKIESTLNTQPSGSFSTDSQQPTVNNQQPTANSQQSTVNTQHPTVNSQQSTVNSQQPTVNSQQSTNSFPCLDCVSGSLGARKFLSPIRNNIH